MFTEFEHYMLSKGDFTTEELQRVHSVAIVKKIRRRQFLWQEGEVCRHKMFVIKGLLRTYRLADAGNEHIMRFASENSWLIDHESYMRQAPSRFYADAIEDSEVILWTKESMDELFDSIPKFRLFSEQIRGRSMDESQQRILINISYSAEEKYEAFIQSHPDVFNRIPLHMVASYLGVSRETLSRIRHSQVSRHQKKIIG